MQDFDHKVILRGLSSEQRASLLEQSDAAGLGHLSIHLGAIGVCSALILAQAPFLPLVMLIQGVLICFLFTLLHETVHLTPFRNDKLNIWVGRLCGFLVFLGPKWFRYFHFAHHRFTHDPEKDPELASPKPATTWQYIKYLSGIPEWASRIATLFRNATQVNQDPYVPDRGKSKVMFEARAMLGTYFGLALLSVYFGTFALVYVWLLPMLIGGPFLRGYLLAEHGRCPHVTSMLENTRTTYTNRIVRILAWNMPYHVEHHSYPAVPFHKLPEFHEIIQNHIQHSENGYLRFNHTYLQDSLSGELLREVNREKLDADWQSKQ